MEIRGKIIEKPLMQSGVSRAGNNWHKQEYTLETLESYPKKVHFDFFGDRVEQYPLEPGDIVRVEIEIESREYNGRWYTSVSGLSAVVEHG